MKQLLELQALDTELRRVDGELIALPKELNARDGELKRAKEAVAANKEDIKKAQAEIRAHENEIKAREEKIAKFEQESNKVRDNAELFAIQHQIKTLREEIGKFEDKALALFSKIEGFEVDTKKCAADLKTADDEFAGFRKNVEAEIADRQKAKAELQGKRQALVPSIHPETYAKYAKLLVAREGQVMAAIEGDNCLGCYMEVVPNDRVKLMNGKEIIHCRHCQRILYLPAEKATS